MLGMTCVAVLPISIHALRKESDQLDVVVGDHVGISIHALRKESDDDPLHVVRGLGISIHALRKESDRRRGTAASSSPYFNPRSP